ncbi:MAG: polyprenyl synthetase family protein [Chitinophagales bacterium]|nr:polyprenyl synthetase family protein [Chitinophagales bacterium]
MSKSLNEIKKVIDPELNEFEIRFKESLKGNTPLLDIIMRYIVSRKGKQMRPMFVFLSAKLVGETNEATYVAASLVELLHTATLVHDDVVDDSYKRRGFLSINALWKNKIAVLVGDFLLAKGLLISIESDQFRLLHILSDTIRAMSEGELLQIEKARRLDIKESIYFDIIQKKTASLISSACQCGAVSVKASEDDIQKLKLIGEKVGIAFQIKDDLLDFGDSETGKPKGGDIKERKLTLPLIYTLNQASAETRKKIIYIVKNQNTDTEKVAWIIDQIRESGGLKYAEQNMQQYIREALDLLDTFPDSPSRCAFKELIHFVITRRS